MVNKNNKTHQRSLVEVFAYALVFIGIIVFLSFVIKTSIEGFIPRYGGTDFDLSSKFGDFVGGTVGTLFGFAGTIFIILTFRKQMKEDKRKQFEEIYYEMIRIHRENVSQLEYSVNSNKSEEIYRDRKVIKEILNEFNECYKEVKKILKHQNIEDNLGRPLKRELNKLITENKLKTSISDLFVIDLCYQAVFYGVGNEGRVILKERYRSLMNQKFYNIIMVYLQQKPKKTHSSRWSFWKEIKRIESRHLFNEIEEAYDQIKNGNRGKSKIAQKIARDHLANKKYKKYYGGHQHRLGHYYRHLFQSYKFLDNTVLVEDKEKYRYGKLLRAQLSTYEQVLLFINSLSALGRKWEIHSDSEDKNNLITDYQLIKNVPGFQVIDLKYKDYYPNIRLEYHESFISKTAANKG